ncbi:MAG: hypothetical protein KGM24_00830 [Elusimicrobia bacterium]|nr:hypothetical protein [Elusimicrobiota bacterium]
MARAPKTPPRWPIYAGSVLGFLIAAAAAVGSFAHKLPPSSLRALSVAAGAFGALMGAAAGALFRLLRADFAKDSDHPLHP